MQQIALRYAAFRVFDVEAVEVHAVADDLTLKYLVETSDR